MEIRKDQRDLAKKIINIYEELKAISRKYNTIIKTLNNIYFPTFSRDKNRPDALVLENKILADILMIDNLNDKKVLDQVKK